MNLLTEGQPMYRQPEFSHETDTENLFGECITPDHLDDALGRVLDNAAVDPRTVLGTVLLEVTQQEQVSADGLHAEIISFSVEGACDPEETADDTLSITYGLSTDKHSDLKQFKAGLGINRAGVPVEDVAAEYPIPF